MEHITYHITVVMVVASSFVSWVIFHLVEESNLVCWCLVVTCVQDDFEPETFDALLDIAHLVLCKTHRRELG